MTITVKKISLSEQEAHNEGQIIHPNYLNLVSNLEVQCNVRIGSISMSIDELRQLKTGQLLQLQQQTSDALEVILNDKVIAKGELMSHEDKFALRIIEVCL